MEDFGINLVLAETVASSADDLGLLQVLGMLLGILGLVFFLGSAVGMVRFPDFYGCYKSWACCWVFWDWFSFWVPQWV